MKKLLLLVLMLTGSAYSQRNSFPGERYVWLDSIAIPADSVGPIQGRVFLFSRGTSGVFAKFSDSSVVRIDSVAPGVDSTSWPATDYNLSLKLNIVDTASFANQFALKADSFSQTFTGLITFKDSMIAFTTPNGSKTVYLKAQNTAGTTNTLPLFTGVLLGDQDSTTIRNYSNSIYLKNADTNNVLFWYDTVSTIGTQYDLSLKLNIADTASFANQFALKADSFSQTFTGLITFQDSMVAIKTPNGTKTVYLKTQNTAGTTNTLPLFTGVLLGDQDTTTLKNSLLKNNDSTTIRNYSTSLYVNAAGDTMTGDLVLQDTLIIEDQVFGSVDGGNLNLQLSTHYNNAFPNTNIIMRASRGTDASPTALQDQDRVGNVIYNGYDGGAYRHGASVESYVDGTPTSSTDLPANLRFYTTQNGASSRSARMTITADGSVIIGSTDTAASVRGGTAYLDVAGSAIRIRGSSAPSENSDGYTGEITWSGTYIYICVVGDGPGGSADLWRRWAYDGTTGW